MDTYLNPPKELWKLICERPMMNSQVFESGVERIMRDVQKRGDRALKELTRDLDGCRLDDLRVSAAEMEAAAEQVSAELKEAIARAKANIQAFHAGQLDEEAAIETQPGVRCWRKSIAIERVGLYVPGGSAPLFSTVLMLGIPAKLAGCKEIVLATPPSKEGKVHPAILYAAKVVGIQTVVKLGGAQAIAAMTFGTESVPAVSKLFGPGNQYVTKAKELAQLRGVAIDMPAGPSEVLVVADESGVPAFIAADLLSQAEHGPDSQVVFATTEEDLLEMVKNEVERQIVDVPRVETARRALANSRFVLLPTMEACFELSNAYAPEHLIVASERAAEYVNLISNAGSVFLGNYSCESAGDYASGTNHTLPTNGFAKSYSGVSVDSFVRKVTFQELTAEGIRELGPTIEIMAEAEELEAHKMAVRVRLNALQNV